MGELNVAGKVKASNTVMNLLDPLSQKKKFHEPVITKFPNKFSS
jgi:hypothetical protein